MAFTLERTRTHVTPHERQTVFAFIADGRNDPSWCTDVRSTEQTVGDGPGVGAVYRISQHLGMGMTVPMDIRIDALKEPATLKWSSDGPDITYASEIALAKAPGGTKITQHNKATFHKMPAMAKPMAKWMTGRAFSRQFKLLDRELAKRNP